MLSSQLSLTVFFEEPFWKCVLERVENGTLSVCSVTFGAEPKDFEIYDWILHSYATLVFHAAQETTVRTAACAKCNPKRMSRNIRKQLRASGVGTKAQQALKQQQEQKKIERKTAFRIRKREAQQDQFARKQQKKKEKHRGK